MTDDKIVPSETLEMKRQLQKDMKRRAMWKPEYREMQDQLTFAMKTAIVFEKNCPHRPGIIEAAPGDPGAFTVDGETYRPATPEEDRLEAREMLFDEIKDASEHAYRALLHAWEAISDYEVAWKNDEEESKS